MAGIYTSPTPKRESTSATIPDQRPRTPFQNGEIEGLDCIYLIHSAGTMLAKSTYLYRVCNPLPPTPCEVTSTS